MLLIQNIQSVYFLVTSDLVVQEMLYFNLNPYSHMKTFLRWSVDELLVKHQGINVFNHSRIDEYKCLLCSVEMRAAIALDASINKKDMKLLNNKVVTTNLLYHDLFIRLNDELRQYFETNNKRVISRNVR